MIIKSGGIVAGGGPRITKYVVTQAENEEIEILEDNNAALLVADEFAQLRGRKNGLLHIIISPGDEMTSDDLRQTVEAIRLEFGFNPADPYTLAMHESKRADGSLQKHYHYVRPAANSETGKTYKFYKNKSKDEAVSRFLELQLGHKLVCGAHNDFAVMRLRERGYDDYADQVARLGDDSIRSAYSTVQQRMAKRHNFDLPALRQQLKEVSGLAKQQQPRAFAELIHDQGLELADSIGEGRGRSRINIKISGIKDHNANRTLKIKATEVAEFISKTEEHLNEIRSQNAESRDFDQGFAATDHLGSGEGAQEQSSNNQGAERNFAHSESGSTRLIGETAELVAAAHELQPQIKRFPDNRTGDLGGIDLEALPDINDPNLLMKLARILKKQIDKANAAQQQVHSAPKFCRRSEA